MAREQDEDYPNGTIWEEDVKPKHLGSNKTKYVYDKPDANILDTFENKHPDSVYLVPFIQIRDEFTSLCPVTNQPDHAKIEIVYIPNGDMVESKSLKLYLFSFRNNGEFHEDVINRICKDLFNIMKPKYIRVFGDFAARGGIAIKPLVEIWDGDLQISTIKRIQKLVDMWDIKNQ